MEQGENAENPRETDPNPNLRARTHRNHRIDPEDQNPRSKGQERKEMNQS